MSSIAAGFRISTLRRSSSKLISIEFKIAIAFPPPSLKIPSIRCSVPIKLCPSLKASSLLKAITSFTRGEKLSSIAYCLINFCQKASQKLFTPLIDKKILRIQKKDRYYLPPKSHAIMLIILSIY